MILAGCAQPPPKPAPVVEPPKNEPDRKVHISGIDLTRLSTDEVRKPLWSVKAKWATLDYGLAGAFGGKMRDVEGQIFEDGKPVSGFKAEAASADKASNTLTLEGKIVVTAIAEKATLRCSKLLWLADKSRIEADGPVEVETESYTIGPFEKAYARADLSMVATPDLFEDKDEKQKK